MFVLLLVVVFVLIVIVLQPKSKDPFPYPWCKARYEHYVCHLPRDHKGDHWCDDLTGEISWADDLTENTENDDLSGLTEDTERTEDDGV